MDVKNIEKRFLFNFRSIVCDVYCFALISVIEINVKKRKTKNKKNVRKFF